MPGGRNVDEILDEYEAEIKRLRAALQQIKEASASGDVLLTELIEVICEQFLTPEKRLEE